MYSTCTKGNLSSMHFLSFTIFSWNLMCSFIIIYCYSQSINAVREKKRKNDVTVNFHSQNGCEKKNSNYEKLDASIHILSCRGSDTFSIISHSLLPTVNSYFSHILVLFFATPLRHPSQVLWFTNNGNYKFIVCLLLLRLLPSFAPSSCAFSCQVVCERETSD